MSDDDPKRSADLPAGFDESDPYDAAELQEYPDWWRENIRAFREHQMRPYRPPSFEDGALVPAVIAELESDLGVDISLRKHIGPDADTSWQLLVDGNTVCQLDRVRTEEGRSVYAMSSHRFEKVVSEASVE